MPYVVNGTAPQQARRSKRTFKGVLAYGGSYAQRISRRRFTTTFGSYQGGGTGGPSLRPTTGQLWPRGKK